MTGDVTDGPSAARSGAAADSPRPSPAAQAIRVVGVTKRFGATRALDDVSFEIPRASVHALCGGNGSGKSTLIKVLAGVYQADAGTFEIDGVVHDATRTTPGWARASGLHFVHQNVGAFPAMTVAENFALGSTFGSAWLAPVRWRALHRRVQEVLNSFEIDVSPRTLMSDVAPATQTMIAVARALQGEQEPGRGALVLDEPTASLPSSEAQAVLAAMRGYTRRGHTVIFVTHRLAELREVADHATFLRDGRHLETIPMAGLDDRGLIERIAGHVPVPAARTSRGRDVAETRLSIKDFSVGPVQGLSLDVRAGEVVGVAGLLGSGRSALLQGLFGVRPSRGTVQLDGRTLDARDARAAMTAGVAYVPEDRAGSAAFAEQTMRFNLTAPSIRTFWNGLFLRHGRERSAATKAISRYGVKVAGPEAAFSSMSGGNQQKVVLARWLERSPRLLLLDEPTQGVDVGARSAIHEEVRTAAAGGAAVVVVSSDPQELVDLCDRVVGLTDGRIVGEAVGAEITVQRCTELGHGLTVLEAEQSQHPSSVASSAGPGEGTVR